MQSTISIPQPREFLGAADEPARGDLVGHVGPSMPCGAQQDQARI